MEERNNKKPLIITLAALIGIIIVTAAVTLIVRGRGGARFRNDDAPYPYSWTEKDDGTVSFSLSVGKAADAAWESGSGDGRFSVISTGETKRGSTGATLTPVAEGRETVAFLLMSGDSRLAELSFTVETAPAAAGHYAATVIQHSERAFQGIVRGGEETGYPFTVRGGDNGLTIYVEDDVGYTDSGVAWDSQSTDGMVAAVSSVEVSDSGVTIQLETRVNGSAEVTVYNASRGISYVFAVEVKDGEMTLTDSRTEEYPNEPEEDEQSEAQPNAQEGEA